MIETRDRWESPLQEGPDSTIRAAIFMFPIIQFYLEMYPIAIHMQQAGWKVTAIFGWKDELSEKFVNSLIQSGINAFYVPNTLCVEGFAKDRSITPNKARGIKFDFNISEVSLVRKIANICRMYIMHKQALSYAKILLERVKPSVVFDGPYWGAPVNQAIGIEAKSAGILYCHLPVFTIIGERKFSIRFRLKTQPHSMSRSTKWLNFFVTRIYPELTREYDGIIGLPHHPVKLMIGWFTGNRELNPWKVPSELYDIVFVETEHVRENLIGEGYNAETVVTSGKPTLDAIVLRPRNLENDKKLLNQLRLGVDTKFVLAYFPPYAEHGILSWQEHGLILEQFIQAFVAIKMPLVLSLHPASAHDYYKKLEERYSFLSVSSESRLIDCYALAECVVLPASSNTLELITYFDIPAVIYDFIGVVDKTDGSFIAATNVGTAFVCSIGDMVEEIHKCLLRPKLDNEAKFKVNFTQKPACNFILETIENKLLYFREVKK